MQLNERNIDHEFTQMNTNQEELFLIRAYLCEFVVRFTAARATLGSVRGALRARLGN